MQLLWCSHSAKTHKPFLFLLLPLIFVKPKLCSSALQSQVCRSWKGVPSPCADLWVPVTMEVTRSGDSLWLWPSGCSHRQPTLKLPWMSRQLRTFAVRSSNSLHTEVWMLVLKLHQLRCCIVKQQGATWSGWIQCVGWTAQCGCWDKSSSSR